MSNAEQTVSRKDAKVQRRKVQFDFLFASLPPLRLRVNTLAEKRKDEAK